MEVWFYIAIIWAVLALVCIGSWIYGLLPKRHKKRMNDKGESVWDQTEFCPTQPLRMPGLHSGRLHLSQEHEAVAAHLVAQFDEFERAVRENKK